MIPKPTYTENDVFLCQCEDPDHSILFRIWDWGKDDEPGTMKYAEDELELGIYVHLTDYPGFWKRLGNAIKYIFGHKTKFGDFDSFAVKGKDLDRMLNILNNYKSRLEEYEKKYKKLPEVQKE